MNRLEKRLAEIAGSKQKALALFLTAGFPTLDALPSLVPVLEKAGADIIEIGMPFSDPLADGPVIQASSTKALENGMTLVRVLENVQSIRKHSSIPLVLMGYLNPILAYGASRFFADAAAAGVDGVILPEVPLEETGRYEAEIRKNCLSRILLVTPTTPDERVSAIDEASSGFVYCVSTTGVTGGHASVAADYIRNVRRRIRKNPLLVGFGISTPEDAARASRDADGVIIGSALIRLLTKGADVAEIAGWTRAVKDAMCRQ